MFIAIWILGLLFSKYYSGLPDDFPTPFNSIKTIVSSFGANVSFSFTMYFVMKFFDLPFIKNKFVNGFYAFLFVSLQEITQWIDLYPWTFDKLDFIFNAMWVCFAMLLQSWMEIRRMILKEKKKELKIQEEKEV